MMISRYSPKVFIELWSDENKFKLWFEIELVACEKIHNDRPEISKSIKRNSKNIKLNLQRIEDIEKDTKHDVIAFLTHIEELIGPDARWLHHGMTSSDLTDTALAILMKNAAELLLIRCVRLLNTLEKRIKEHTLTPMIGRSHGIHAEPITFGLVLAGHYSEIIRGYSRLINASKEISVGKISGAVGTYAHLSPEIEYEILKELNLSPETVSTQIISRDRHANYMSALSILATSLERFATNIRHMQRSEVGEVEESFSSKQKGSSAMPHKRNPILSENLCGLARVVRSTLTPALENISLWHERDISHSSVERVIIPEATSILGFMLDRTRTLIENLVVYPENMKKNLDNTDGLYFSESVLLSLVDKGMKRQNAYIVVQRNAMKAWRKEGKFKDLLSKDREVRMKLNREEINKLFNINNAFKYITEIVDKALKQGHEVLGRM